MSTASRVAVIGLGRMGGPMADHLIAAGHAVAVYDVAQSAMAPRLAAGAEGAASPAEAARGAGVVCIVVFDDQQAAEVVEGADGVLASLEPGAVIAVHTTVTLETVRQLSAAAAVKGVFVVDAGISGGEDGAQAGTLVTMVGGPDDAFGRVEPVLKAFSKEVLHPGALGAGMALKLTRNAAFYGLMSVVHEAMEMALRTGVDLELLRHTLVETGALTQCLAPFALGGPEPLPVGAPREARAAMEHLDHLAAKDLGAALTLAHGAHADVPVLDVVQRTFRRVARLGEPEG